MVPVVDLVEIGNGGGSIAWVDDFGKLHVGPHSAGAVPGPAAYGRGGDEATTTDANLWLGRINKDYFCGGEIVADMEAAEAAIGAVGDKLGVDADEAARGIIRIANNNMVNALKLVSLNRGYDPRDFTLVAFGGGGGMHAVALAAELGVQQSRGAGGGLGVLGLGHDDVRPAARLFRHPARRPQAGIAAGAHRSIVHVRPRSWRARNSPPKASRRSKVRLLRYGKFRYQNQEHTTEVLIEGGAVTDAQLAEIETAFHAAYEREYTYRLDAPVEIVGMHLVAAAEVGKLKMTKREPERRADAKPAIKGRRKVDYALEGRASTPTIYDGTKLEAGMTFKGPAIIEDPGATVVVHPGNQVEIDGYRQHPHSVASLRGRAMSKTFPTIRSRWKSSRTRCRRPPTKCSR